MSDRPIAAGPHDDITDVTGIELGHATDLQRATGCTVIIARAGARPGVFQPGGAPGTLDTDLAAPENAVQDVHAVLLTGGSVTGLDAAADVRRVLQDQGVGLPMAPDQPPLPIVMGAVVFDLMIGQPHGPPDGSGRDAAINANSRPVAQGSVGVGTGCTIAKTGPLGTSIKGGVGSASLVHDSGLIVGAVVATNAVGDIINPANGRLVAGARADQPGQMLRATDTLFNRSLEQYQAEFDARFPRPHEQAGANTTLCVVATNARLHKGTARRVAIMASAGLSRTISPIFTPADGDTIFTLATGDIDVTAIPTLLTLTGAMAAEAVAAATLRSVERAQTVAGIPSVRDWTANLETTETTETASP